MKLVNIPNLCNFKLNYFQHEVTNLLTKMLTFSTKINDFPTTFTFFLFIWNVSATNERKWRSRLGRYSAQIGGGTKNNNKPNGNQINCFTGLENQFSVYGKIQENTFFPFWWCWKIISSSDTSEVGGDDQSTSNRWCQIMHRGGTALLFGNFHHSLLLGFWSNLPQQKLWNEVVWW